MSSTGASRGSKAVDITADGAALAASGRLCGLLIAPTGAVTPTITVYDNASAASGTKLAVVKVVANTPFYLNFGDEGVNVTNGVYVTATAWTTLNATAYVK